MLFLLFAAGCASAGRSTAKLPEGLSPAEHDAVQALTDFLAPDVVTLTHETLMYNYTRRDKLDVSQTDELDLSAPEIKHYFQTTIEYFADPYQPLDGSDARGFYLATDPVASRRIGGANWILFELRMPKGLRYLDTTLFTNNVGEDKDYASTEMQTKLKAAGCDEEKIHKVLLKTESAGCRKIGIAAIQALGVHALAYDWTVATFTDKICEKRKSAAFILLDPAPAGASLLESAMIYTKELPSLPEQSEEATKIETLFGEATDSNVNDQTISNIRDDRSMRPWVALEPEPTPHETLRAWVSQHLYGCQE